VGRRVLLVVDGLLVVAAALLATRLHEAWTARPPSIPPEPVPAVVAEALATRPAVPDRPPLTAYAAVAERNLFSSTRTEAGPEPARPASTAAIATPPAPRPRLYGIVLLAEGRARAYLEDVQRRRVFAYSVGDLVGDARLEEIKVDRVVLRRGGETFEVLLRDPTKPRQSAAPSSVQSPEAGEVGRPTRAGRPTVPGPTVRPAPPPAPAPAPGLGPRSPGRPRVTRPVPPPTPEGGEPNEEE
jgi:hypothetical protein